MKKNYNKIRSTQLGFRNLLLAIVFLLLYSFNSYSQKNINCDGAIYDATALYNDGKYDECISFLQNALSGCKFSKNVKTLVYELMINSSIEKDSLPLIDKYFVLLLKNAPQYNIKDYIGLDDFTTYFKNYYVYPKIDIGLEPYTAFPVIGASRVYSVLPGGNYNAPYNTGSKNTITPTALTSGLTNAANFNPAYNTNLNKGSLLFFNYRFNDHLGLCTDAGSYTISYSRDLSSPAWNMQYSEYLVYTELSLGAKYYFNAKKRLNFYAMGGVNTQLLLKATSNFSQSQSYTSPFNDSISIADTSLSNYNSAKLRRQLMFGIWGGAGISYRIKLFTFGFEARFYYYITNVNYAVARYSEPMLLSTFNYVDNDMQLSKFELAFTVAYNLKFDAKKK